MSEKIKAYAFRANVGGNCGLGVLYNHSLAKGGFYYSRAKTAAKQVGGTGFVVTGFVDSDACQAVYDELKDNYEIIYQSPVRRNRNSGNDFFFCVYDTRGKNR